MKKNEIFIENSKKIHGDKYDYSLVYYINAKLKVKIICKTHGTFLQTPKSHISRHGCSKCANENKYDYTKLTTEIFIERAQKIHGHKYKYDKSLYQSTDNKIIITCKIHGDFEQSPYYHLRGNGCKECSGCSKLTTKDFIDKSIIKHGNEYDYSKVHYINNKTKVIIICHTHGEFTQAAGKHLSGQKCSKCQNNFHSNTEEFIKKSNIVHNNIYDYSKVKYKNTDTKVVIACKKHGEFLQTPYIHLRGSGCPKCYGNVKLTTSEFVEKAICVHGNKYDYRLSNYRNSNLKIIIICKKHGEFEQRPNSHLNGKGCRICGGHEKYTQETFIKKCNKKHNNKYDYSETTYNGIDNKIKIICKKHGQFEQTAYSHSVGIGCPSCKSSHGEMLILCFLIDNNILYKHRIKFIDCVNPKTGRKLEFDFYLPEYNICIEYDGKQHFESIEHFGGIEEFEKIKFKDTIKNKYCIKQKIKLIRISYKNKNNINLILTNLIKKYHGKQTGRHSDC